MIGSRPHVWFQNGFWHIVCCGTVVRARRVRALSSYVNSPWLNPPVEVL